MIVKGLSRKRNGYTVELSMMGDTFLKNKKFYPQIIPCQGGAVEIFVLKILPSYLDNGII